MISCSIKGASEIVKLLKQLPDELIKKEIRKDTFKAMKAPMMEAKRQAPVDEGRLQEFITRQVVFDKNKLLVTGRVGIQRMSRKQMLKKKLTLDAYYATFVEFGTRFQAPQRFMRTAFEITKGGFLEEYPRLVHDSTEKTIERLRKKR